jgi:hypothetical protein
MKTREKPKKRRIEICQDSLGLYRWTLYDGTGVMTAKGCQGHDSIEACKVNLETVIGNIRAALPRLVYLKTFDPVKEIPYWEPV